MLTASTSTAIRRFASKQPNSSQALVFQLRSFSAVTPNNKKNEEKQQQQRRNIHQSAVRKQADVAQAAAPVSAATPAAVKTSSLMDRFAVTAEVTVSKIFPAGFGWQTASIIAGEQGFADTSMNFALTTGLGDALGVLGGHCAYYAIKKSVYDKSIDMSKELHNGILLGSAAFCSGTAWQPVVNALQGANLSFPAVFAGTWVACGAAFYAGLRMGRTLLPLQHIEKPSFENSQTDVALSVAIGGATGFFVGTDAAYMPEQNFLIGLVGIQDGTPDIVGCAIAGSSTSLGFLAAQSTLNMIYPTGKCWND